jgi:tetratricopeptide (TPR) repeat protein
MALVFVAIVLGGLFFLLKPSAPTSSEMPGGAAGAEVMGEVLKQVGELKEKLEADPMNASQADPSPLAEIYGIYGQVGKLDKAREYLQLALDGIATQLKSKKIDDDKAIGAVADIAQVAVMSGDMEGALTSLTFFHELKPADLRVLPFLGNLCYDLGRTEEALKWYDMFLAEADPEKFAEYWNVKVDRATMYLSQTDATGDKKWLELARRELEETTKAQPAMFNAWFNLGQVHLHDADRQSARPNFVKALELAGDDSMLKYKAEREIALLDGKAPPEMPNPHGEGMSLEEMGLGPAREGMENPHGEGFGGGM